MLPPDRSHLTGGAQRTSGSSPPVQVAPTTTGELGVPRSLNELPEFLTVEEAAAVLRIGRTSAYSLTKRWRQSGGREGLPVEEFGRVLRVPRAALVRMCGLSGDAA
jgi:hypothetical protein